MKKKTMILIIGIMLVISLLLGTTYAYWQITENQENTNDLVAACLDLKITEETGTFGLPNAWPITDAEGMELDGYSFTVQNNCKEAVNYAVGIDSLATEGKEYLGYENLKVQIDNNAPKVYSELEAVQREGTRASKIAGTYTIEGSSENEVATQSHTVRVWIASNAPVSEQNKVFIGKVFIIGGQGIDVEEEAQILVTGNISKTGSNVNYAYYSDGSLDISGNGEMYNFYEGDRSYITSIYTQIVKDYITQNGSSGLNTYLNNFASEQPNAEDLGVFGALLGGYADTILPEATVSTVFPIIQYDLPDNTLIEEFNNIYAILGRVKTVTVGEGITNISCYAFISSGPNVVFNFPTSLTNIGDHSFYQSV